MQYEQTGAICYLQGCLSVSRAAGECSLRGGGNMYGVRILSVVRRILVAEETGRFDVSSPTPEFLPL